MSAGPYISIATPAWNASATVRRTLDAMSGQQASFEHVVYDGGSSDGTLEIVNAYAGKYPLAVIRGPNLGVYGNVANAHRETTGEVMGWINADDFYLPFALGMVEQVFRTRPDIDWLTGVPTWHWEGEPTWALPGFAPIYIRDLIRRGWYRPDRLGCLQQESMFWRRSLYEKASGDTILRQYRYAADFQLWRAFAVHAKLHTVRAALAAFTIRQGQFSERARREYEAECGMSERSLDLSLAGRLFNRIYSNVFHKQAVYKREFAKLRRQS